MNTKRRIKYVHEGRYAAAVEVDELQSDDAWSPYLSARDAMKLDEVREALRKGDLSKAAELARVYELTPIAK